MPLWFKTLYNVAVLSVLGPQQLQIAIYAVFAQLLKGVTRVEVDYVKVNSHCTECNKEVIADRNLQIPGPECEKK